MAVVVCDIAAAASDAFATAVAEESDEWMCAEGAPHDLAVASEVRELVADAARTASALPCAARAFAAAAAAAVAVRGGAGEVETAGSRLVEAGSLAVAAGQAAGQAVWDMAGTLHWYLVGTGVQVALETLMDHVADAVVAMCAVGGAAVAVTGGIGSLVPAPVSLDPAPVDSCLPSPSQASPSSAHEHPRLPSPSQAASPYPAKQLKRCPYTA